jgi:hypothetical protein
MLQINRTEENKTNWVCQWLATGQWFSSGTPVSSTHKTDYHNITESGVFYICIFIGPNLKLTVMK